MDDLLSGMEALDDESCEDEKRGPPEVDEVVLQPLDREAAVEEVERLMSMNVIEWYQHLTGSELVLDTRQVYDWRYRDGQWKRRCRLVAREFRDGAQSTEETFAPTSSKYVVNISMILCLVYQLSILLCDIKDAFLTVAQGELVIVEVPDWIQERGGESRFWKLCRFLPCQRKAALHWNEHLEAVVQSMGFVSFEAMPTVLKHGEKKIYLTIHVDDLLVIGSIFDCNWFLAELSKHLNLKSDGPFPCGQVAEVQYSKKNLIWTPDGIANEPCKQYIPKLLELLRVENRREKSLPNHANLEAYHKDKVLSKENLTGDLVKQFRGGLGLCLYLAQDRPVIQESVRVLSNIREVQQFVLFQLWGIWHATWRVVWKLEYFWRIVTWGRDWRIIGWKKNFHQKSLLLLQLNVFVTAIGVSGMIFLNGNLVLSFCKSQTTIFLSSCEAEIMATAMTHMTAEGIMVCNLCKFLLNLDTRGIDSTMDFIVYTDSSSAKLLHREEVLAGWSMLTWDIFGCSPVFGKSCWDWRKWVRKTIWQTWIQRIWMWPEEDICLDYVGCQKISRRFQQTLQ